jgi:hypothetical protein
LTAARSRSVEPFSGSAVARPLASLLAAALLQPTPGYMRLVKDLNRRNGTTFQLRGAV